MSIDSEEACEPGSVRVEFLGNLASAASQPHDFAAESSLKIATFNVLFNASEKIQGGSRRYCFVFAKSEKRKESAQLSKNATLYAVCDTYCFNI